MSHPIVTNDQEQLEQCRKAWANVRTAETQLARLAVYTRLTPGMKDDRQRYRAMLSEAEGVLTRILGARR